MPFVLMLFSCEGRMEKTYPQGFSTTELSFSTEGGDAIITSQRDEWTLADIVIIEEKYFYFARCEEIITGYYGDEVKPGVCSDSLFTVKYDILKKYVEIVEIEGDWFKIAKVNPKQLNVFIAPNLTGEIRQIRFPIYNRHDGISISIVQSGE